MEGAVMLGYFVTALLGATVGFAACAVLAAGDGE